MDERKRKRAAEAGDGAGAAEGAAGDAQPRQQQQQQQQQQAQTGEEGQRQQPAKRTYGQRRAKPDPVNDAAAPVLSAGLLKLIAGKRARQE